MELEKYREIGKDLYNKLRLLTHPVAVRFIENLEKDIPAGTLRPSQLGKQMKMTLCQGFTFARRHRLSLAITAEDNVCIASTICHGWEEVDLMDLLKSQELAGYKGSVEAEEKVGKTKKLMPPGKFKGMIVSPLTSTLIEPHVVLVYGNSAQMHHLITSFCYKGIVINSNFYDTGESCMKGLIEPYLTGKPQIVIPGLGDRVTSMTGDDELAMGIPASLLPEAAENLFKAKIRQPISFLMPDVPENLTPAWPFLRGKLKEKGVK